MPSVQYAIRSDLFVLPVKQSFCCRFPGVPSHQAEAGGASSSGAGTDGDDGAPRPASGVIEPAIVDLCGDMVRLLPREIEILRARLMSSASGGGSGSH